MIRIWLIRSLLKSSGIWDSGLDTLLTLLRDVIRNSHDVFPAEQADEVSNLPENQNVVGRVLSHEQKLHLFRTAAMPASPNGTWRIARR